jgi:hypothetical protein
VSKVKGSRVILFVVGAVVICILVAWGLKVLEAKGKERGLQAAAVWTKDFHDHRQEYEELLQQWSQVYPLATDCGAKDKGTGLVEHRLFDLADVNTIRLAGDAGDHEVTGFAQAANVLHVPVSTVKQLANSLSSLQKHAMSQSEGERRIWSKFGNTDGLMHVSPACPQYSNYQLWSHTTGKTPFFRLNDLGEGWFYFDQPR